jgi:hypothetical protein
MTAGDHMQIEEYEDIIETQVEHSGEISGRSGRSGAGWPVFTAQEMTDLIA